MRKTKLIRVSSKSGRVDVMVRMPPELRSWLVKESKTAGLSLSKTVLAILESVRFGLSEGEREAVLSDNPGKPDNWEGLMVDYAGSEIVEQMGYFGVLSGALGKAVQAIDCDRREREGPGSVLEAKSKGKRS